MVYSDTTTNQGILQEIESILFASDYGKITGNTALLQTFTRYCNHALDDVTSIALLTDTRWQFDDVEHGSQPIGTINIVSGTQAYAIPSTYLKILKVLIKDSAGTWVVIPAIDIFDQEARLYLENNTGNEGIPNRYDKNGSFLLLDPVPNYSSTGGLKVYFQRAMEYFATSDTAKEPGIASIYHRLIPLKAALMYAVNDNLAVAGNISAQVNDMEREFKSYMAGRDKDDLPMFRVKRRSSR